jgi:hypothetical protein
MHRLWMLACGDRDRTDFVLLDGTWPTPRLDRQLRGIQPLTRAWLCVLAQLEVIMQRYRSSRSPRAPWRNTLSWGLQSAMRKSSTGPRRGSTSPEGRRRHVTFGAARLASRNGSRPLDSARAQVVSGGVVHAKTVETVQPLGRTTPVILPGRQGLGGSDPPCSTCRRS